MTPSQSTPTTPSQSTNTLRRSLSTRKLPISQITEAANPPKHMKSGPQSTTMTPHLTVRIISVTMETANPPAKVPTTPAKVPTQRRNQPTTMGIHLAVKPATRRKTRDTPKTTAIPATSTQRSLITANIMLIANPLMPKTKTISTSTVVTIRLPADTCLTTDKEATRSIRTLNPTRDPAPSLATQSPAPSTPRLATRSPAASFATPPRSTRHQATRNLATRRPPTRLQHAKATPSQTSSMTAYMTPPGSMHSSVEDELMKALD